MNAWFSGSFLTQNEIYYFQKSSCVPRRCFATYFAMTSIKLEQLALQESRRDEAYLELHSIRTVFQRVTQGLVTQQPADVHDFVRQEIQVVDPGCQSNLQPCFSRLDNWANKRCFLYSVCFSRDFECFGHLIARKCPQLFTNHICVISCDTCSIFALLFSLSFGNP